MTGINQGCPIRATCPDKSRGEKGIFISNNDPPWFTSCPGTGTGWGSTFQYTSFSAPYAGARLWVTSSTDVRPGRYPFVAETIESTIDFTTGDSGSPLWFELSPGDRRVVGVASHGTGTNHPESYNAFNRWTTEVYNFFVAYSTFPN